MGRRVSEVLMTIVLLAALAPSVAGAEEMPLPPPTGEPYHEIVGAPTHPGDPFPAGPTPLDTSGAAPTSAGPEPAPPPAEPTLVDTIPLPFVSGVRWFDVDTRTDHLLLGTADATLLIDRTGAVLASLPHGDGNEPTQTDDALLFLEEDGASTVIHRYAAATGTSLSSNTVAAELDSAVEAGADVWFLSEVGTLGKLDVGTGTITLDVGADPVAGTLLSSDIPGVLAIRYSGDVILLSIAAPHDVAAVLEDVRHLAVAEDGSRLWTVTYADVSVRDPSNPEQVLASLVAPNAVRRLRHAPDVDALVVQIGTEAGHYFDPATSLPLGSIDAGDPGDAVAFARDGAALRLVVRSGAFSVDVLRPTHEIEAASQPVYRLDLAPTIRLQGVGFGFATEVTVNDSPVDFDVVAGDSLTFQAVPVTTEVADISVSTRLGSARPFELPVGHPPGTSLLSVTGFGDGPMPEGYQFGYDVSCTRPGLPSIENSYSGLEAGETQLIVVPTWATCQAAQHRHDDLVPYHAVSSGHWDPASGEHKADIGGLVTEVEVKQDVHLAFRSNFDRQAPIWVYVVPVGGGQLGGSHRVTMTCPGGSTTLDITGGSGRRFTLGRYTRCTFEVDGTGGTEVTSFGNRSDRSGETRFRTRGADDDYLVFFLDHGGVDRTVPVVIGAPGEAVRGRDGAGVVHVFPVDGKGEIAPAREFTLRSGGRAGDPPERGDGFGTAVVTGDFDGDGYIDIAVGAPSEDLDRKNAGQVHVVYGRMNGYKGARRQVFDQSNPGIPGSNGRGDRFGASLAVYDSNGDGLDDLAIGVPGERISGVPRAGRVVVLLGAPQGLTTSGARSLAQGDGLIPGMPERGDRFGSALAGDGPTLAIGTPFEDVGRRKDAGVVTAVDHVLGRAEDISRNARARDLTGAAVAVDGFTVVWGAPGTRGSSGRSNVGYVHSLDAPFTDRPRYAGASPHVPRVLSSNQVARFGTSLAIWRDPDSGDTTVLAGAPGDNGNAGAVVRFTLPDYGEKGVIRQGNNGVVPNTPDAGDRFGQAVHITRTGALVIGAPGESTGGAVRSGSVIWIRAGIVEITQRVRGVATPPQDGDQFGAALGG